MEPAVFGSTGDYKDHIELLDVACAWLAIERGRAIQYTKLIRELFEHDTRSPANILAYFESCEIADICLLWKDRAGEFPGLYDKIKSALAKGPVLTEDERANSSSNRPRNDSFSYFVAGLLASQSMKILAVDGCPCRENGVHSEADIAIQLSSGVFDIECKRPRSRDAIVSRTKEAVDQVRSHDRHGIAFVVCSVVIRPPGYLLEATSGEAAERQVYNLLSGMDIPKLQSLLTEFLPGVILYGRIPAMTRASDSKMLSKDGHAFSYIRPECVFSFAVVNNALYSRQNIIHELARSLSKATRALFAG